MISENSGFADAHKDPQKTFGPRLDQGRQYQSKVYVYKQYPSLGLVDNAQTHMPKQPRCTLIDQQYKQMFEEYEMKDASQACFFMAERASSSRDIKDKHLGRIILRRFLEIYSLDLEAVFYPLERMYIMLIITSNMVQHPQLQLETSWIMGRLISSEFECATKLADLKAESCFIRLIMNKHLEIAHQAVWGLCALLLQNKSKSDNPTLQKGVESLLAFIKRANSQEKIKIGMLTLAKIYQLITFEDQNTIQVFTLLCSAISKREMFGGFILAACCQAINNHCKTAAKARLIFESKAIEKLIQFILDQNQSLSLVAIKIVELISALKCEVFTNDLISLSLIDNLNSVFTIEKTERNLRTCRTIVNLSKGSTQLAKLLFEYPTLIMKLFLHLSSGQKQKRGMLFCFFADLVPFCEPFNIFQLYRDSKLIQTFLFTLNSQSLQSLPMILELGEYFKQKGKNVFARRLEQQGGRQKLQSLLLSNCQIIVNQILMILNRYFYE